MGKLIRVESGEVNTITSRIKSNTSGRVLCRMFCFGVLVRGLLSASSAAEPVGDEPAPVTIYFYSPESSVNNYGLLKDEFDGYLAKFGNIKIQPFKSREYYDSLLAGDRVGLYLMPSWHFRQLPRREGLVPVLVGELDGRTTQTHALWARSYAKNMAVLSGATVATARSKHDTAALMKEITGDDTGEWISGLNLKFLEVPKDIDALMAVIIGAAGVAIATDSAGSKLAETNPKQWETLKVLSRSRPSLLPLVVVPKQDQDQLKDAIRVLSEMGKNEEGRERLKMIGLDGWKDLEPDQLEELLR